MVYNDVYKFSETAEDVKTNTSILGLEKLLFCLHLFKLCSFDKPVLNSVKEFK